ncbi:HD domain-containing protein [bacterium]|nr:HD domain-containing protein [bacterium]
MTRRYDLLRDLVGCATSLLNEIEGHTSAHAEGVATLSVAFAQEEGLTLSDRRDLFFASLLHDIGETTVPLSILAKESILTEEERRKMESHTVLGDLIVRNLPAMSGVCRLLRHHHESWDGTGYPDRLFREEFDPTAQILSMADLADTLSRPRPYRSARTPKEMGEILSQSAGTRFESKLVHRFSQFLKGFDGKGKLESLCEAFRTTSKRLEEEETKAYLLAISMVLSNLLGEKLPFRAEHPGKVAMMSIQIARTLGLSADQILDLKLASFLCDIGILAQDERIYLADRDLTKEESAVVKLHPLISEKAVSHITLRPKLASIVRSHQERWDGSGYPDGLKGEEIPLESRIIHLADTYVALQEHRPYRPAQSHKEASEALGTYLRTLVDPHLSEILLEILDV